MCDVAFHLTCTVAMWKDAGSVALIASFFFANSSFLAALSAFSDLYAAVSSLSRAALSTLVSFASTASASRACKADFIARRSAALSKSLFFLCSLACTLAS